MEWFKCNIDTEEPAELASRGQRLIPNNNLNSPAFSWWRFPALSVVWMIGYKLAPCIDMLSSSSCPHVSHSGWDGGEWQWQALYPGVWAWLVPLPTRSQAFLTRPRVRALSTQLCRDAAPSKPPAPRAPWSNHETPDLWTWHFLKCHTAPETFRPGWLV